MNTQTQGASILDKCPIPKDSPLGHMRFEGIWNYGIPLETAGPPSHRQLARSSSGMAPFNVDLALLFPDLHENVENKFQRLSRQWKHDTGHMSMGSRIVAHPAYLEIIAIGKAAIPLILGDLAMEPNHWFSALSAIAGDGPNISEEDRGNIMKISQAWLEWGKSKKYIE